MSDNSFLKNYLKGEASYGFWNIITRLVAAVNTFITLSYLTLYEYGSFQLLLVTYAGAAVFLNIGGGVIRNDILRFEAEGRSADAKKLFFESLVLKIIIGVILCLAVFYFAPVLSFKYSPGHIFLVKLMSLLFLHDALLSSFTTIIEMRKRFNVIASRLSIVKFSQLAVLLYFVSFRNVDLQAVVISLVISMLVSLIFLVSPFIDAYSVWSGIKKSKEKFLFKILRSYGKWEVVEPLVNRFTAFFETWAIKLFISTEAVAIFSIAQMIIATLNGFLPVKTLLTLVPMEVNNEEKLRKIYTNAVKYIGIFSATIAIVAFFSVPIIIGIFFDKYLVSLTYFKALLLTLPLYATIGVSSIFLISLRRQKFLLSQKILKTLIVVPLYILLLPHFGLWGLVIQSYIWLIVALISIYVYLRNTKPHLFIVWSDVFIFSSEDKIFIFNTIEYIKSISKGLFRKVD